MAGNLRMHWMIRGFGLFVAIAAIVYGSKIGARAQDEDFGGDTPRCTMMCSQGISGGCFFSSEHKTLTPLSQETPNGGGGLLHSDCYSGGCVLHSCSPDPGLVSEIADAIDSSNQTLLTALIKEKRGVVRVNGGRSAIQIRTCNGSIAANLPISSALLGALNEASLKGN